MSRPLLVITFIHTVFILLFTVFEYTVRNSIVNLIEFSIAN